MDDLGYIIREIENYDKFYNGKFDGSDSKIVISKKQDFVESPPHSLLDI